MGRGEQKTWSPNWLQETRFHPFVSICVNLRIELSGFAKATLHQRA